MGQLCPHNLYLYVCGLYVCGNDTTLVSSWTREDNDTRARVESKRVRYEEEIYDLEMLLAPAQLLGGQDSENHGVWKTVTVGRRFGKEVQGSPKQLRSTIRHPTGLWSRPVIRSTESAGSTCWPTG